MSEELKPCPFCGGEADVHYFAHDDSECTVMCSNSNCRASVSARSCGSMTTAYNRARKLWNRRAERTCRPEVCDDGAGAWGDGNIYVLMVTARKTIAPALAPATPQGAIDAMCSFETFPAAVSDDVEALREHARKMCERFTTIDGWNVMEVPVIGGDGDGDAD